MSKMNSMSFWLELNGFDHKELDSGAIESILSVKLENGRIDAAENFIYPDNGLPVFYEEIAWLLSLIEPKVEDLKRIGVCFEDSAIWMIYEFFAQCNMEFDAGILKRIGELGLKLCVSCYEDTHLANRESFNGMLSMSPNEGVYITTTIGTDIKVGDVFPFVIEIENERKDHSFILTSIDIDKEFVGHFDVVNNSDQPKSVDMYSEYQTFLFDYIIKANTKKKITIYLKSKEEGIFRGCVTVCEGGQYIENEIMAVVEE